LWQLDFDTFHIEKKIKKFKSDKTIIDNFKKIVVELANSDNPRSMGDLKHGRYRYCYGIHLTKICMVDITDHDFILAFLSFSIPHKFTENFALKIVWYN
jgi:hypothetical protein